MENELDQAIVECCLPEVASVLTYLLSFFCSSFSLLGQGYNLQQLLDAADETSKIRKSREASMKGRFETFKKVFSLATKPVARIVAAKSG